MPVWSRCSHGTHGAGDALLVIHDDHAQFGIEADGARSQWRHLFGKEVDR